MIELDEKIVRPAEARFVELLKRKADLMGGSMSRTSPPPYQIAEAKRLARKWQPTK